MQKKTAERNELDQKLAEVQEQEANEREEFYKQFPQFEENNDKVLLEGADQNLKKSEQPGRDSRLIGVDDDKVVRTDGEEDDDEDVTKRANNIFNNKRGATSEDFMRRRGSAGRQASAEQIVGLNEFASQKKKDKCVIF